jgi:hypothetical protein
MVTGVNNPTNASCNRGESISHLRQYPTDSYEAHPR